MKDTIARFLKGIETNKDIQILYACESGSRAWGFPSPDSDYDIRFIYRHERDWYLTVNEKTDSIQVMPDEILDGSGWDIRKVLRLLYKSNVSIFEWLNSPIVYSQNDDFTKSFRQLAHSYFLPKPVSYHYLGIAKSMLQKEFQTDEVKIKKYFYVLRPVLAAYWVLEHQSPAPMEFNDLLKLVSDKKVLEEIQKLLEQKKVAKEGEKIPRVALLDDFIKRIMEECEDRAAKIEKKLNDYKAINLFYRNMLEI